MIMSGVVAWTFFDFRVALRVSAGCLNSVLVAPQHKPPNRFKFSLSAKYRRDINKNPDAWSQALLISLNDGYTGDYHYSAVFPGVINDRFCSNLGVVAEYVNEWVV